MSRIREAEKERVGDSQEFYQGGKCEKRMILPLRS